MILGFMLESLLGPARVAAIYFISGIGGNIFSALCYPSKVMAVGASTSIFGLVATLLAVVFVNWKALDRSPEVRCCLIIMVIFILMFSLLMAFSGGDGITQTTVDGFGHLGGLLVGFAFASYMMVHFRGRDAQARGSYENMCKLFGLGAFAF